MHKALIVLLLVAGTASAAEIRGTIQLATKTEGSVQVTYEALTFGGKRLGNMAGLTVGDNAASVSSDTYKPRHTGLKWDPQAGLTFEHVDLPTGKYLIAVKNQSYLDWKVVDLPADATVVNASLTVDHRQTGKLQVQISQGVGDYQVVLLPLTADNQPPVAGLDLTKSYHLRLAVDVEKGLRASFAGVKAGRYQVLLRAAKRMGAAETGFSTMFTDLGTANVTVEAGKETQMVMP